MTGRLAGKIAVVTGGAGGMGEATVRRFVTEGARVVIADLMQNGAGLAQELGLDQAMFVALDVTSESAWLALDKAVRERFGPVQVLVNNAGIFTAGLVVEQDVEVFQRTLTVNVTGTMLGMKTLAPGMIAAGGGSIINISSSDGLHPHAALGAYSASKWAVRGLTKVAALELSHQGVRVNSIHPGPIDTPMANPDGRPRSEIDAGLPDQPIGRVGMPEEVAAASLFLASDDASFVTGAELAVDGGMSAGGYLSALPGLPPALRRMDTGA